MFPSRWCCRQLFVIPALLAPLWSGRHYCAEGLWGAGLRTRSAVTWFPVVRDSGCISAAATGPGCNQEGNVRKPVLLVPPCPPPGHPDDHGSWGCGPVPGPRVPSASPYAHLGMYPCVDLRLRSEQRNLRWVTSCRRDMKWVFSTMML